MPRLNTEQRASAFSSDSALIEADEEVSRVLNSVSVKRKLLGTWAKPPIAFRDNRRPLFSVKLNHGAYNIFLRSGSGNNDSPVVIKYYRDGREGAQIEVDWTLGQNKRIPAIRAAVLEADLKYRVYVSETILRMGIRQFVGLK